MAYLPLFGPGPPWSCMCWDGKRPSVWWWMPPAVEAPNERLLCRKNELVCLSICTLKMYNMCECYHWHGEESAGQVGRRFDGAKRRIYM